MIFATFLLSTGLCTATIDQNDIQSSTQFESAMVAGSSLLQKFDVQLWDFNESVHWGPTTVKTMAGLNVVVIVFNILVLCDFLPPIWTMIWQSIVIVWLISIALFNIVCRYKVEDFNPNAAKEYLVTTSRLGYTFFIGLLAVAQLMSIIIMAVAHFNNVYGVEVALSNFVVSCIGLVATLVFVYLTYPESKEKALLLSQWKEVEKKSLHHYFADEDEWRRLTMMRKLGVKADEKLRREDFDELNSLKLIGAREILTGDRYGQKVKKDSTYGLLTLGQLAILETLKR